MAVFSDAVVERRSQRPEVWFDVEQSGLRGCVGRSADEKLGAESGGAVHGYSTSMARPADGGFDEVAKEENAAAMNLRQAGETIEKRARLRRTIEVALRAQKTVPGIEDHEVGVGFLERVFKIAQSGVRYWHGSRRDGSTQDDQARGISVEAGEARLNDLRGSVFRWGVQDGGWFELFSGEWVAATSQRRRDGEGDPSLSWSWLPGKHR
jgi:hypothetical protein